jgi:hypothetical protein
MIRGIFSSISHRITSGNIQDGAPLLNIPADTTQNNLNPTFLSSTTNGGSLHDHGMHLRAKLRFFFMSPCWKWHLKRQFPWKAWFQFIKIIIVTTQVNK